MQSYPHLEPGTNQMPGNLVYFNSEINNHLNAIIKAAYPECTAIIENLQQRNTYLEKQLEEQNELKDTCTEQAKEINELKKKLRHAQDVINKNNQYIANNATRPFFKYEYNLMDFEEDASPDDLDYLFDTFYELVNEKLITGDYLLDCASSVIPIYIVITHTNSKIDPKWTYHGTLADFCEYWNKNVIAHIEDKERARKLKCKAATISAELKKKPWNECSPVSWRSLADDKKSRNRKVMGRAYNIKKRLESKLK